MQLQVNHGLIALLVVASLFASCLFFAKNYSLRNKFMFCCMGAFVLSFGFFVTNWAIHTGSPNLDKISKYEYEVKTFNDRVAVYEKLKHEYDERIEKNAIVPFWAAVAGAFFSVFAFVVTWILLLEDEKDTFTVKVKGD